MRNKEENRNITENKNLKESSAIQSGNQKSRIDEDINTGTTLNNQNDEKLFSYHFFDPKLIFDEIFFEAGKIITWHQQKFRIGQ